MGCSRTRTGALLNPLATPDSIDHLLAEVRFNDQGLALAIAVDAVDGEILMAAWTNRETLRSTLLSGIMTYWSRSRSEVWVKGATSGHEQEVVGVDLDCDGDALRFRVRPRGGVTCHTGRRSCFFRTLANGRWSEVSEPVHPV